MWERLSNSAAREIQTKLMWRDAAGGPSEEVGSEPSHWGQTGENGGNPGADTKKQNMGSV